MYIEEKIVHEVSKEPGDGHKICNDDALTCAMLLMEARYQRRDLYIIIQEMVDAASSGSMANFIPVIDKAQRLLRQHKRDRF